MITISLCMIVRNEESTLIRCLESVANLVDEIIIVDTGSTDKTVEIAKSFQAKIYEYSWNDNFSNARNFSFQKASKDYILWLDADDVICVRENEKLLKLKETMDVSIDSVVMNYNLSFDNSGNPNFISKRNRLVKRSKNFMWNGYVHEYLAVSGNILHTQIAINHQPKEKNEYSYRNLFIYLKQMEMNQSLTSRDQLYFANELFDLKLYDLALVNYQKFTKVSDSWKEDKLLAWFRIADCYERSEQTDLVVESLLKTLQYDVPRPEFSCRMGYYFLENKEIETAIHWYTQALSYTYADDYLGFINNIYQTWLPHLQLSVCYDKLGEKEKALTHHEIAYKAFPDHPSIKNNQEYFKSSITNTNML